MNQNTFSSWLYWTLLIGVIAVLLGGMTTSLWFLRGILGQPIGILEVGYQQNEEIVQTLGGMLSEKMDSYVGFSTQDFYRLVYVQDEHEEYIVGIPRPLAQPIERATLQNAGWQSKRFLWILAASRPRQNQQDEITGEAFIKRRYTLWEGVKFQSKSMIVQRVSSSPLFFFRASPGALSLEQPIALYGDNHPSSLVRIAVAYDSLQFDHSQREKENIPTPSNSDLFVSLSSDILSYASNMLKASIDDYLAGLLHFTKTNPAIISSVPEETFFGVASHGNNIAIGIQGSPNVLRQHAEGWMNAEQGNRHPRRKAFTLPDGSLGYEYIPGVTESVFAIEDGKLCNPSSQYDEQLFFCNESETAVLSSEENVGKDLISHLQNSGASWGGYAKGETLRNIFPQVSIESIRFAGDEKNADIWVNLK